jgi:stalled ribosome alternative rescue factor ArfA
MKVRFTACESLLLDDLFRQMLEAVWGHDVETNA